VASPTDYAGENPMPSPLPQDARNAHSTLPGHQLLGIVALVLPLLAGLLSTSACHTGVSAENRSAPNIVFILTDDTY
jgi:hypothetical protein